MKPYVVVAGLKFAFYEQNLNGMIGPSAKKVKEGVLQIEGTSLEECEKKVQDFINSNGVVILNEK